MSETLDFIRINSAISTYTPANSIPARGHELDPTTILILQWMGASARSRALASIYQKYHLLFPFARIVSVRSMAEWFITTSTSTRLSIMKPVVSVIQSDPSPQPKIFIHLFSNGGALAYVDICTLHRSLGLDFATKGIVLDSAPGQPDVTEAWAAMSLGLPKGVFWYPSAAITVLVLGAVGVSKWAFGMSSIVDKVYEQLNNFTLVGKSAGRLYIYSESDKLVNSKDVERHIRQAKGSGVVVVDSLKEVATPHVQHLILDNERYWQKVEAFWEVVKNDDS